MDRTRLDDLAEAQGCFYDDTEPRQIKEWIEANFVSGKDPFFGQPLKLMDWQYERVIRPLFGWYRPGKGPNGERLRRFTRLILFVPRRCGKTYLTVSGR